MTQENSTTAQEMSKAGYLFSYQERNNLTDGEFCSLLGVTKSALYSWRTAARVPSESAYKFVLALSVMETLAPAIHEHIIR